jgi:hypothetical protein
VRPIPLIPLVEVVIEVEPPITTDRAPMGELRLVPIVGGSFTGAEGTGIVLPGGADWQTIRADDALEIRARYVLETFDDERIAVHSSGVRTAAAETLALLARGEEVDPDDYYFRSAIRFTTGAARLARWNSILAVATGARRERTVELSVWEVT